MFAIRAVDDRGAVSEPIERAFYSFGVAPVVQIEEPRPSTLLSPSVTPAVRIGWTGKDFIDPNGYVFEKPLYYKYKLYKQGHPASPGTPGSRIPTPCAGRSRRSSRAGTRPGPTARRCSTRT